MVAIHSISLFGLQPVLCRLGRVRVVLGKPLRHDRHPESTFRKLGHGIYPVLQSPNSKLNMSAITGLFRTSYFSDIFYLEQLVFFSNLNSYKNVLFVFPTRRYLHVGVQSEHI